VVDLIRGKPGNENAWQKKAGKGEGATKTPVLTKKAD